MATGGLGGGPFGRRGPGGCELLVGGVDFQARQASRGEEAGVAAEQREGDQARTGGKLGGTQFDKRFFGVGGGRLEDVDRSGIGGHRHASAGGRGRGVDVSLQGDGLGQRERRRRFGRRGLDLQDDQRRIAPTPVDRNEEAVAQQHRRRGNRPRLVAEGEDLEAAAAAGVQHKKVVVVGQLEDELVLWIDGGGQGQRLRQLHVARGVAGGRIEHHQAAVEGGHEDAVLGDDGIGGKRR